ncbi:MAG: hypothetical protein ACRDFB_03365 [Rhabdochlamydiaceae bacterium]
MRVKPGIYQGEIKDYGISQTKGGDKQAFMIFEIKDDADISYRLTWYGLLNPVAKNPGSRAPLEFTVKVLLDCGFDGMDLTVIAGGIESNSIPLDRKMSLTIEDNEWEGNVTSKIRFVNPLGFSTGPNRVSFETVTQTLDVNALRAELLKQRESRPAVPKNKNALGF